MAPDVAWTLVPLAAQVEMPWANGGGRTRQVAIEPPDGSLAGGFRWRVSVAVVGSDGPFSRLPGVDRSLWLVDGAGVALDLGGRQVVLSQPGQRCDFAGETPVAARRLGGTCRDANLMVARGAVRAAAALLDLPAGAPVPVPAGQQRLLLVLAGAVAAAARGGPVAGADEALRGGPRSGALVAVVPARVLVVGCDPA